MVGNWVPLCVVVIILMVIGVELLGSCWKVFAVAMAPSWELNLFIFKLYEIIQSVSFA